MSTAPRHPHPRPTGGPWLRILVVLVVAMLATGPHPEAFTASAAPAVTGTTEGAAEHDVLDTALRPSPRQGHRALAAQRPATGIPPHRSDPGPAPASAVPAPSPLTSVLHTLRCVVLRC
ncbi:hypothetical protein OG788_22670 [Streptomyces sp. NBC_00647]|uniref:hypothetical protein n=1 Tax=Streptomyces sp. NBC_00647 TaxID=2975796 RepID=UPI0032448A54